MGIPCLIVRDGVRSTPPVSTQPFPEHEHFGMPFGVGKTTLKKYAEQSYLRGSRFTPDSEAENDAKPT